MKKFSEYLYIYIFLLVIRTFLSQQKKIPESFLGPKIFRHFFSIGVENLSENMLNSLEGEHRAFGDLLLLPNLVDTYSNLTRKTLLSIESIYRLYDFSFMLKVYIVCKIF